MSHTFVKPLPENTEIIVDYNCSVAGGGNSAFIIFSGYASGTALIPKKK
jgi:hypothetical protein